MVGCSYKCQQISAFDHLPKYPSKNHDTKKAYIIRAEIETENLTDSTMHRNLLSWG